MTPFLLLIIFTLILVSCQSSLPGAKSTEKQITQKPTKTMPTEKLITEPPIAQTPQTVTMDDSGNSLLVGISEGEKFNTYEWESWVTSVQMKVLAGDFNGDGMDDVMKFDVPASGYGENGLWVGISDGTKFITNEWERWSTSPQMKVLAGDFNGDDMDDVMKFDVPKSGSGEHGLWVGISNGNKFITNEWERWSTSIQMDVLVGNFNGDEMDDVMKIDVPESGYGENGLWVGISDGTKFITNEWERWSTSPQMKVLVGDFNGDGLDDVMKFDVPKSGYGEHGLWVGISDGTKFITNQWERWSTSKKMMVLVGDFNGDGMDDVMKFDVPNSGTGEHGLWVGISDGTKFITHEWERWDTSPQMKVLAGDFNGDGMDDVMKFDVPRSGYKEYGLWVGLSESTRFITNKWAQWKTSPQMKVLAGDFNNDVMDDVMMFDVPAIQNCGAGGPLKCSTPWWAETAFHALIMYDEMFHSACVTHDYCYRHGYITYGRTRLYCDDEFYENMVDTCNKFSWDILLTGGINYGACRAAAKSYYIAVRELGAEHYKTTDSIYCEYQGKSSQDFQLLRLWVGLSNKNNFLTYQWTNWYVSRETKVLAGDFNGDGLDDVMKFDVPKSGYGENGLWVGISDSTKFITNEWEQWSTSPQMMVLRGDFNGDGMDDVMKFDVPKSGYGEHGLWVGISDGNKFITNEWERWSTSPQMKVLAGDFNGDGMDDVMKFDAPTSGYGEHGLWVGISDGNKFITNEWERWSTSPQMKVLAGDFNGDGMDDVMKFDVPKSGYGEHGLWVGISDGNKFITNEWERWSTSPQMMVLAGDFNGDGMDDVMKFDVPTSGYGEHGLWVGISDGSKFITNEWERWSTSPQMMVLAGDFNGDGMDDVMKFDVPTSGSGEHGLWVGISDGSKFITNEWERWYTSPQMKVLVGDFNNDENDDIVQVEIP